MRTGQREPSSRMIKHRVAPGRGGVTLLTGLGEGCLHVVGIGGALEVFQVTRNASCVGAGQVVVAIHVTLHALH